MSKSKFERYFAGTGLAVMLSGIGGLALENGHIPFIHPHHASKPAPVASAKHGGHGQGLSEELATVAADMKVAPVPSPSHENATLTDIALGSIVVGFLATSLAIIPDKDPSRRRETAITPAMIPVQQPSAEVLSTPNAPSAVSE